MQQSVLAVGDAFGTAMTTGVAELVKGTTTAQEVFAQFLNAVANALLQAAAQMIATYVAIGIARMFAGFGGKGGDGGNAATALGSNPNVAKYAPLANGGVFDGGFTAFAKGGMFTNSIVSSPTLFRFADGAGFSAGLMGEAGPEAIMPLTRGPGGRLGVDASGSGESINVTVNVDASGSKVQGDDQSANQLGRVVANAVQQELIKQKRPGGLLS
jgi:lambda family phage tail tape measure protein